MNYPEYKTKEEQKTSKYNSAVAQLYRLDNLWQSAQYHSRNGYLLKWNYDLDAIWRELAGDTITDDDNTFAKMDFFIAKYKTSRDLLYQLIVKKEIFLRKIQNKQGKGTAYVNPDDDLLEDL